MSQHWDTATYQQQHAFVWQYGTALLEILNPQPGEHILDLGCGTGQLTEKIAIAGANVSGIDTDPAMIEQAKQNYPHLSFAIADARSFKVNQPLDAVFSNAVLHWVKEPEAAVGCISRALKPGGRFIAEFGGKGNVGAIVSALYTALKSQGFAHPETMNPWYFPSISEYTSLLEQQGFEVTFAALFDRPTPLQDGKSGMAAWLRMFANSFLSTLTKEQQAQAIQAAEEYLRPTLYQNGSWIADYRRLRITAIKVRDLPGI